MLTVAFLSLLFFAPVDSSIKNSLNSDLLQAQLTVSSGGVSLGSYQSGYLLAQQERANDPVSVKILTGASAGAINSVAGLFYVFHSGKDYDPYGEWLNIGWQELVTGDEGSVLRDRSLFTTRAIDAALDRVIVNLLKPPDSDILIPPVAYIGFSVSRFLPPLTSDNIGIRKADLKFVIGVKWEADCPDRDKKGGCYHFWSEPLSDVHWKSEQPVLWFGKFGTDTSQIRRNLKGLALASSAFPIAFPPRKLEVFATDNCYKVAALKCLNKNECEARALNGSIMIVAPDDMGSVADREQVCMGSGFPQMDTASQVYLNEIKDAAWGRWETDSVKFSDGGIFDNQPLELALRIYANAKSQPSEQAHIDGISKVQLTIPTRYMVNLPERNDRRGMIDEWIRYLLDRRPDPSELELARAMDNRLLMKSKLRVNTTSMPLASEHFQHFSGFFAPEFRQFDFLIGYLDGKRNASKERGIRSGFEVNANQVEDTSRLNCTPSEDDNWSSSAKAHVERWLDTVLAMESIRKLDKQVNTYWASNRGEVEGANFALNELKKIVEIDIDSRKVLGEDDTVTQILRVLKGSINRLIQTNNSIREDKRESGADRFVNFQKGLGGNYSGYADTLYFQAARVFGHDAYGLGSSWLYPFVLYAGRVGISSGFGEKPTWSSPYLKAEFSSTGIAILQGFTMPKDWLSEFPYSFRWWFSRERFEFGPRASKMGKSSIIDDSANWKGHIDFRTLFEIQIFNWLSVLPSVTKTIPFYQGDGGIDEFKRPPDIGVGLLIGDHLNMRLSYPKFWSRIGQGSEMFDDFRLQGGVQAGFNIYAISEGLRNGTLKQRRKP